MERSQFIDIVRGVDVLLMVTFNCSVTLSYFRLTQPSNNFLYWSVFPIIIASIFIFLSGTSAYASYKSRKKEFEKTYLKRGVKLLVFSAAITLFTYVFVPSATILFGILHFFAITSFVVPFFVKNKKIIFLAGVLIILLGLYLQTKQFDFSYLLWLGLVPKNFLTLDYFPIMPWFGVLLLGVYFGKDFLKKTANIKFKNKFANIFTFFGKNSLVIYLVHQPILVVLLFALGFRLYV